MWSLPIRPWKLQFSRGTTVFGGQLEEIVDFLLFSFQLASFACIDVHIEDVNTDFPIPIDT